MEWNIHGEQGMDKVAPSLGFHGMEGWPRLMRGAGGGRGPTEHPGARALQRAPATDRLHQSAVRLADVERFQGSSQIRALISGHRLLDPLRSGAGLAGRLEAGGRVVGLSRRHRGVEAVVAPIPGGHPGS